MTLARGSRRDQFPSLLLWRVLNLYCHCACFESALLSLRVTHTMSIMPIAKNLAAVRAVYNSLCQGALIQGHGHVPTPCMPLFVFWFGSLYFQVYLLKLSR